jgi:hypothetical protein
MAKIICIVGVTGNQGGSVAQRFLKDPSWCIRGLTRNPSSPAAQKLAAQGIEIVQADLDKVGTLIAAFQGANLIFSVTNYWEPFFRPDCRQKAADEGMSCRKYAYDVELQQGKNIADAAAKVADGLDENGFIASTLSHASISSKGQYKELYHFDAKADVFPHYVNQKHPKLAAKMSYVQTGYFTSSYKLAPGAYFSKVCMSLPALDLCSADE